MTRTCGVCGGPGHYRPKCPQEAEKRRARDLTHALDDVVTAANVAVAPPPIVRDATPRPFVHVERQTPMRGTPERADLWETVHRWRHEVTGAEIVATCPATDAGMLDGMVALRRVRDAAHVRRSHPTATVTEAP